MSIPLHFPIALSFLSVVRSVNKIKGVKTADLVITRNLIGVTIEH